MAPLVEPYRVLEEIAQLLFQLAWADGQVQSREVEMISSLLEQLGMPLGQRLALMDEALTQPPPPTPLPERSQQAALAMQCLVRLCFADHQAHPEELALLAQLAARWGISADQLEQYRLQALQGT